MPTKVSSILRKITRSDRLNIQTFTTHESYEKNWEHFSHNFFSWYGQQGVRSWNRSVSTPPKNYYFTEFGKIKDEVEIDLVLSQSPDVHYPLARQLSDSLDLPIVNLWHTFPTPNFPSFQKKRMVDLFSRYHNVFITEDNKNAWGFGQVETAHVIKHGIDTSYWTPKGERKRQILTVANDFVNRNWCLGWDLWTKVVGFMSEQMLPVRLVGDTPGISRPSKSREEMLSFYQESLIFLNTALASPIPMSLLEGMSCGLCPVSTKQGLAGKIIQHGYNGILCEPRPDVMRQTCIELLHNPEVAEEMGHRARETVIEMFPMSKFVEEWNKVFEMALK